MAAISIRLTGIREGLLGLARLRDGAEAVSRTGLTVGSRLGYSGYVEYGTRRMRARPYLRPAVAEVERGVRATLVAALPQGARPVVAAILGIGTDLVRAAQRFVPVRTGNLRRSIYSRSTGRAG